MSDMAQHTVDPKFTYTDKRSGKPVVLYQGLLDAAHRAGLVDVTPVVLQFPNDDNAQTCIVMATARFADGRSFSSIGDANPKNVGSAIVPHFIRMAETRAKGRALRDALNVGMITVEELGGRDDYDDDAPPQPAYAPQRNGSAPTRPAAPPAAQSAAQEGSDVWTTIWTEARAQGIKGRAALEEFMGVAPGAPLDTAAVLRQLRGQTAAAAPAFAGAAG